MLNDLKDFFKIKLEDIITNIEKNFDSRQTNKWKGRTESTKFYENNIKIDWKKN